MYVAESVSWPAQSTQYPSSSIYIESIAVQGTHRRDQNEPFHIRLQVLHLYYIKLDTTPTHFRAFVGRQV